MSCLLFIEQSNDKCLILSFFYSNRLYNDFLTTSHDKNECICEKSAYKCNNIEKTFYPQMREYIVSLQHESQFS